MKHAFKELGSPSSMSVTHLFCNPKQRKRLPISTWTSSCSKIHCKCAEYKGSSSLSAITTALRLSKRGIHFYSFIWALLSCPLLRAEFPLQRHHAYTGIHIHNMTIIMYILQISVTALLNSHMIQKLIIQV